MDGDRFSTSDAEGRIRRHPHGCAAVLWTLEARGLNLEHEGDQLAVVPVNC